MHSCHLLLFSLCFSWYGSETAPLLFANNPPDQNHQHHSFYSTPQNWPCLLTSVRVAMPSTTQSTSLSASSFCTEDLRKSPANSEYAPCSFWTENIFKSFLGQREQAWCKSPDRHEWPNCCAQPSTYEAEIQSQITSLF